ncbi:hypothetical protein V6N13_001265 [Hibiscus sabdariffa]
MGSSPLGFLKLNIDEAINAHDKVGEIRGYLKTMLAWLILESDCEQAIDWIQAPSSSPPMGPQKGHVGASGSRTKEVSSDVIKAKKD